MSDIGKTALKNKIDAKIYDNESQLITGAILNEVLQDAVDTLADGGNLDAGSVDTSNLKNNAVTTAKITDGNVTKAKIASAVTDDIDYAVAAQGLYQCTTEGSTAAKEVTATGYELRGGGSIKIKFTNKNTASSPTLSINGSLPKQMMLGSSSVDATNTWEDGDIVEFVYYPLGNVFYGKLITLDKVSVSQNSQTGKTELLIGNIPALIVDNEPEAGSDNLIKSGGVYNTISGISLIRGGYRGINNGYIADVTENQGYGYQIILVSQGEKYHVEGSATTVLPLWFTILENGFVIRRQTDGINVHHSEEITIQENEKYLVFNTKLSDNKIDFSFVTHNADILSELKQEDNNINSKIEHIDKGIVFFDKTLEIASGSTYQRASIDTIENDIPAYVIIKGTNGKFSFRKNYTNVSEYEFEDEKIFPVVIPKTCDYLFVELSTAASESLKVSVKVVYGDTVTALNEKIQDLKRNLGIEINVISGNQYQSRIESKVITGPFGIETNDGYAIYSIYEVDKDGNVLKLIGQPDATRTTFSVDTSGYYKVVFSKSDASQSIIITNDIVTTIVKSFTCGIIELSKHIDDNRNNITDIVNKTEFLLEQSMLEPILHVDVNNLSQGRWNDDLTTLTHTQYVRNNIPIPVKKGDYVSVVDVSYWFAFTIADSDIVDDNINILQARNLAVVTDKLDKASLGAVVDYDGFLYITVRRRDNSNITPNDVALKIRVVHYGEEGVSYPMTEVSDKSMYANGQIYSQGYRNFNDSTTQSAILVQGIAAKAGDIVMVNDKEIGVVFYEYDYTTLNLLYTNQIRYIGKPVGRSTGSEDWYTGVCDYYIVQNDCILSASIGLRGDLTTSYLTNAIKVVHIKQYDNTLLNLGLTKKIPISAKKYREINLPVSVGRYMQGGTVINGKLWMMYDNYLGDVHIEVINIESGATEKTILCDFNHAMLDYNINNDSIIIPGIEIDGTEHICIFDNVSSIVDSIQKENAILTLPIEGYACWGENTQTIYTVTAGSVPIEVGGVMQYNDQYKEPTIKKIILGLGSNQLEQGVFVSGKESNEYNGTYRIVKTYNGKIRPGIDFHVSGNGSYYIQDVEYDGYLYMAIGTCGNIFLMLELDEHLGTYKVVGNYWWQCFDSSQEEENMESELVALNGNKIICGSRHYSNSLSSLVEFER